MRKSRHYNNELVDDLKTVKRTAITRLGEGLNDISKTALGVVHARVAYGGMIIDKVRDPLGKLFLDALAYAPQKIPGEVGEIEKDSPVFKDANTG